MNIPIREWASKVDPYKVLASLTYEFEELGIEIADGFEAGSFSGSAELEIFSEGFGVSEIWIDVSKFDSKFWVTQRVKIEHREHPQLWSALERAIQKAAEGSVDQYVEGIG